ncbi:hypothetical protein WCE41_14125 [Luteimonas sp. MJ246]|uniref:hypothetical protein n=1 Tax=Luteimonas sp. MJ174 TaxID=3129237 RepID=UPI0031BAEE2A
MNFTDHVEISDWNGQCLLTVRDVELHDYLDDFFVQAGLEPLIVQPSDRPGQLQLLFAAGVTGTTIHRLLSQVRTYEIDRIVGINGGAMRSTGGA